MSRLGVCHPTGRGSWVECSLYTDAGLDDPVIDWLIMADNRLYLYDPETGEKFTLAKSTGSSWYIKDSDRFGAELDEWLSGRTDARATYGGTGSTSLQLLTEGDLPENKATRRQLHDL